MNYPSYSYPSSTFLGLILDTILLRRRVFRDDAKTCVQQVKPPLQVLGKEHLPQSGSCVITCNHYYRPGFNAWWMTLAISSVITFNIHWIITAELIFPGKWYAPLGMPLSRSILKRGARIYGFATMPPMPPRPRDVEARAASVRAVLNYVKQTKDPIIGLAPEGGDQIGGQLTLPASGTGRFGLLLAAQGLRFAPVGVYESDGEFCLHFGEAYDLSIASDCSSDKKDKQASRLMMDRIAPLLPSNLRGEFA